MKTKKFNTSSIITALFISLGFIANAQMGVKYIGGTTAFNIQDAAVINKNRIILNYSDFIMELDSNFNIKKSIKATGILTSTSSKYGITKTRDGIILAAGNLGGGNIYLYKFDNTLSTCLYAKNYGNIGEINAAYDKNAFIADSSTASYIMVTGTSGSSNAAISKFDSLGNSVYCRKVQYNGVWGGRYIDYAKVLNSIYIFHEVNTEDPHIAKTDLMGNVNKAFRIRIGDSLTTPVKLLGTSDKKVVVYGEAYFKGSTKAKYFIMKCDSSGATQWCKLFTPTAGGSFWILSSEELANNYILGGTFFPSTGGGPGILINFDANGNFLGNKTYNSAVSGGDGAYGLTKISNRLLASGQGNNGPTFLQTNQTLNFNACASSTVPLTITNITPTITSIPTASFTTFNMGLLTGSPSTIIITNTAHSVLNPCGLTTGIDKLGEGQGGLIYPNPANDRVTIESPNASIQSVKIINLNGQILLESKVDFKTEINLELNSLQTGIYFIEVKTNDGSFVKKIIKE